MRLALRLRSWKVAVKLAALFGHRDENQLTNMVFFARHPELGGRPIRRGERQLAREWVKIRDTLVRPVLKGSSSQRAGSNPAGLPALRSLAGRSTAPTVDNALRIVKAASSFHRIPWRVAFTILQHEGGVRLFRHGDGVMQTTRGARRSTIPRVPRPLKLAALGRPSSDSRSDAELNRELHREFPRRLAVQITAGVQEIKSNLDRFRGYVGLAFTAYNAGSGWSYYMATKGRTKRHPKGVSETEWEKMCGRAATRLHQLPSRVRVPSGLYQCDANIPTWFARSTVRDPATGLALIAYKYLRKIRLCRRKTRPAVRCNRARHRTRLAGSGPMVCKNTRFGAFDKLYDPRRLARLYRRAVAGELGPLSDDGKPLQVVDGRLETRPPRR